MKRLFLLSILIFSTFSVIAQVSPENKTSEELYAKPKLVVGVVVDQMRYDYITRFWPRFGNDGFKKLIGEGFNLKNNHFNYVPTYTGPGHSSVYTGAAPETHGIISNNWFDKFEKETVYCAGDPDV